MSTDVSTPPTRLTERDLAERSHEILDRVTKGEPLIIERDGKEIALITPINAKKIATWGDLLHFLAYESTFDEEYAKIVRELRESQPPARYAEWPE